MKILLLLVVLLVGCECQHRKPLVKIVKIYQRHIVHIGPCRDDMNECNKEWRTITRSSEGHHFDHRGKRGEVGQLIQAITY